MAQPSYEAARDAQGTEQQDEIFVFPTSFAQQGLWFVQQMQPQNNVAYSIAHAIHFAGPLDVAALEQSLNKIIWRHEILRTTFELVDGEPMQIIGSGYLALPIIALNELSVSKQEIITRQMLREEIQQPFDLTRGPLLRFKLVRFSEQKHLLISIIHHIIFDNWSMNLFERELSLIYTAIVQGQPVTLPELPIQYADYAAWQRQWVQEEIFPEQRSYWVSQLEGALDAIELPIDHPRPAQRSFSGACHRFTLPLWLIERLKGLGRQEEATLFMVLLAAFQVLLSRYSGQEDLLIGTPVAGRNRTEVEGLIGCFVNTLVLRGNLAGNPSFRAFLKRTRKTVLEAFTHQDFPFERLVEELQPVRDAKRTPLVQVVFAFQNIIPSALHLGEMLTGQVEAIEGETAKFDLVLDIREASAGTQCYIEYSTDLFEEGTIARMAGHFRRLLEGIVDAPQQALANLPLLSEQELQSLTERQTHQKHFPQDACIHELFEMQVERTPDAIAIVFENQQLTYSFLNTLANQLAHLLQMYGVRPEVRVGLLMERTLDVPISILGILKAGGAYVPLDPTHPAERLSMLLSDAQVAILLTRTTLQQMPVRDAQVFSLDASREILGRQNKANPKCETHPEHLAYIIYTSGSTGEPKGVLVNHLNVSRLFAATRSWFDFNALDTWAAFHSFAFDFSVWEVWGALLFGGKLVMVPYEVSRSPEIFNDLLWREHVTVLNQTPSAFRQLLQAVAQYPRELKLRLVIFGGEALNFKELQPWFSLYPDDAPQLINMYGITETTVHVTYYPLTADSARQGGKSVIGQAIPDLDLYVLDTHLQPAPIGVPGEIYVGGAGLARGYLNHPAFTAERFVPHPYSSRVGERLYRTGDLAKWGADGHLEYLGRNDQQVKIRGFRVELGEIEALLLQHPGVREAVVLPQEGNPGKKRLVAWIVPDTLQSFSTTEFYTLLSTRLPEYMLPAAFVIVDALPMNANGKIDRQALLALEAARPELPTPNEAPQTPVERILAEIWESVLGIEGVSVHDNFFSLGGDSIRSIRVLALAKKRGITISLSQLFQRQTIRKLAQEVLLDQSTPPIVARSKSFDLISESDRHRLPADAEDAYPLTVLQLGMLFHSAYSPSTAVYHDISSFRIQAPYDILKFRAALQLLVLRQAVLRTSFDLMNFTEPLQLVQRNLRLPLHVEDLRWLSAADQESVLLDWIHTEKSRKFEWINAPLWRIQVHRLTENIFHLTLTCHHSILDGWSVASMITELLTRYMALVEGNEPLMSPPELTTRFRDFVALEREMLTSESARRYWAQKLADGSNKPLFRSSFSSQAKEVLEVRSLSVPFSREISKDLGKLAKVLSVPLKSVLLTTHLKVLGVMSGHKDLLTGLVVNGRPESADGEQVLGLFLNTLPFRQCLGGGSWKMLVKETFENEQELLPFRRYPLANIQHERGGEPLFDTVFNFVHFHVYGDLQKMNNIHILEESSIGHTNFPLIAEFSLDVATSLIELRLVYDPAQFSERHMQTLAGYYSRVLTALAYEPDANHNSVSLLSDLERHQLLKEGNEARIPSPWNAYVHERFELCAEYTPDSIAVCAEEAHITYAALNRRANQCAHYLQTLGVGPEVPVGLCVQPSVEMLIGLLGILKAGGAYVPLNPDHPTERLLVLAKDAHVVAIVTQETLARRHFSTYKPVVCLDTGWSDIARTPETKPACHLAEKSCAYILFTSGSTGKPKGVVVEHRQLTNYIRGIIQAFDFISGSRSALLHSLSVDFCITTLFPPLCSGGTLCVMPLEWTSDPQALGDWIQSRGIDCLKMTPSHLKAVQASNQLERVMPNRLLILGGEASNWEWTQTLQVLAPQCKIFNHYGPTETTVGVLTHRVSATQRLAPTVPAGRPIADTQIYLLDVNLEPVPAGTPGDLYIGGASVTRGYLNSPDLTAERFIPDPFSSAAGSRLYKTGDLARYLPEGAVEFIGRKDDQVKIRGYRVELGEVTATLRLHPHVREAAVLAYVKNEEEKSLLAYIVPTAKGELTAEALRAYLAERIPGYMVPAGFVFLEALPLTAHGKLNRQALSTFVPIQMQEKMVDSFVAPRTPLENVLAEIWAEILKVERVGVNDKFFALGGHSLLAMQIISRIRHVLEIDLPVRYLFEIQTIAELAIVIEMRRLPKYKEENLGLFYS